MLLMGASACSDSSVWEPEPDIVEPDTEVLGFGMRADISGWDSRSGAAEDELAKIKTAIPLSKDDAGSPSGKFLFLKVSDISNRAPGSPEQHQQSRGSEVTSTNFRNYYQQIGLTGICFSGPWDTPTDGTEHVYYIVNDCIKMFRDPGENYDYRWKPDENYYWSGIHRENIRFFAYAPFNSGVEFDTERVLEGETAKFNYTTPADITKQIDLSADAITCPGDFRKTVPLQFHHILSQVNFSVGDPILAGTIHSIRLKGVKRRGTYTFNFDKNVITAQNQNPTDPKAYVPGEWSDVRDTIEFYLTKDIPLPGDPGDIHDFDDGCTLGPWYAEGWTADDADRPQLTGGEYTLFLLPQELTEDIIVEIEMTLPGSEVPLTYRAPLYSEKYPRWEPGKKYEYMISNDVLVQYFLYFNSHFDPQMSYPGNTSDRQNLLFYNHDANDEPYDTLYYKPPYTGSYVNRFVQSFQILARADRNGNIVSREREDIEWHPMYVDKDGNQIDKPDWITFSYDAAGGNLRVEPQTAFAENRHNRALREATPVGTRQSPVDLSLTYNGQRNTANTYIINAPGWYMLPLVYGNAIKDGAANPSSYAVNSAPQLANYNTDEMLYPNFVDHRNIGITTPWIPNQVGQLRNPTVVWQNAYNLVDPDSLEIRGNNLVMYISPITIGQGNSTVAVRDAAGRIAWSWHIWATDFMADATRGSTRASTPAGEVFDFMDVDVGWHFPEPDIDENGQEREVFLKLVQHRHTTENKAEMGKPVGDNKGDFYTAISKDRLRVVQSFYEVSLSGAAPYYQWGRPTPTAIMPHVRAGQPRPATREKRAIQRRLFNISTAEVTLDGLKYPNYPMNHDADGNQIIEIAEHMTQNTSIGYAITKPHVFFHYELTNFPGSDGYIADDYNINSAAVGLTWWGAGDSDYHRPNKTYPSTNATFKVFWNLWCTTNDGRSDALADESDNVVKTIYDPSPAGFCVAPKRAFKCFSQEAFANTPYDGPDGCWGYRFNVDGGIIFFPATGWLVENYPWTTPSYALCMWPYGNYMGELMTSTASAIGYNTSTTGSVTSAFHIAYRGTGPTNFHTSYTSSPIFGQPVRPVREK